MIRPGSAVAACVAAAITYQITHAQRALRNEARIHEGDLETHQVHIDRLNARCGITDSPALDECFAADAICDGLQERNWTRDELDGHAVIGRLLENREEQS
jgi:hypothetical protein